MLKNLDLVDYRTKIPITQVHYIPNFLSDDEIESILGLVNGLEFQNGDIIGEEVDSHLVVRQSQIKWIKGNDKNWWVYEKILNVIRELNNSTWNFELDGINEYIQYTEYQTKGNFYDWHMDVSHEEFSSNRKLSFECVLDDNHSGSEFSILLGPSEHKVKLGKGSIIVYPSFLINKIYSLESGIRKTLVGWAIGPAFR